MGYFGNVSTITGNTATVELKGYGIVTGLLKIPNHIIDLAINDFVMCVFTSSDFQQGVIIAKMG